MTDREVVAHLLRRATFGPTAAEVDAAEAAGFDATLAGLLAPTGPDAGAVATPLPALGPDPYATLGKKPDDAEKRRAKELRRDQILAVEHWWLSRLVRARHQLTEKMVFFWHGHWATSAQKVKSGPLMLRQLETLRASGRGDFAVLVKAMLRDAALIFWLDGQRNTRRAPNENLGRELMELFTLGVGSYTEDDVKAGARALTGWTIDRGTGATSLVPARHDGGAKTILSRTANFDADTYADLLVAQPANAAFLAGRLWFRFASGEPLPAAVADRLAAAYRPHRNVDALLRALFRDSAFAATRGQLVKQPVEWLVGAMRQLALDPAGLTDDGWKPLLAGLDGLGQVPLRPPSVGGWPDGTAWLTTSSLPVRLRLSVGLATKAGPAVLDPLAAGSTSDKLVALARLLTVDAWTDRSRASLAQAAGEPRKLLAAGLVSPEYTVT